MRERRISSIAVVSVVFGIALAAWSEPLAIGDSAPTFALTDVRRGTSVSLDDFDDARGVLLLFIAAECPVSNDYNERMAALAAAYGDRGIIVLGINSNRQESVAEIRNHAEENGLDFPILKDTANEVADAYGAQVTPEAFLLGRTRKGMFRLRYHGAIDDSQDPRKVQSRPLTVALDAFLSGKPIRRRETKAFGSTIKRVKRESADATR